MRYPFWDVAAAYGILMAGVAVIHVFISHFAIGGGLYLVVSERAARKAQDAQLLEFLQKLSKFFVLVTLVGGVLSGVGIWFVIGLLNPAATEVLIHIFVWAWATEWALFAVEILAATLYFYGWKRMEAGPHMALGWIYFVSAWLSLFVVNGILTFMLTPGRWLETGNMWDGFFNPTFWPSLVLRTAVAVMLAGLYALLVAARAHPPEFKGRMVRQAASWGLVGLAAAVPSLHWYWTAIPATVTAAAMKSMPVPILALRASFWCAGAIAVLLASFGLLLPRRQHVVVAAVTLVAGLGWLGSFEWFREAIRKPYIITGYIYGNGIELARADAYRQASALAAVTYRSGDAGADLFRHMCRSCHTLGGYNPLKPAFDGTDRPFIAAVVRTVHMLKGNMPPFAGTPGDADAIAGYLEGRTDRRPLAAVYGLRGAELGKKVFALRCAKCHTTGTVKGVDGSVAGLGDDDYRGMLENAADLGEGMPAFTGDKTEREALISYFKTLGAGTK